MATRFSSPQGPDEESGDVNPSIVGVYSPALASFRDGRAAISTEFGSPRLLLPGLRRPSELTAMAGSGESPESRRAQRAAARWKVPYLRLEEGFLRRPVSTGNGRRWLSMVVDPLGIYHDASRASHLEELIQACDSITPAELTAALQLMDCMQESGSEGSAVIQAVSTTGAGPEYSSGERPLVLLVDQDRGDPAVLGGLADGARFTRMLQAARDENPDAELRLLECRGSIGSRRRGYLAAAAAAMGIPLSVHHSSPVVPVRAVHRVYTVSGIAGMDALILGIPVSCFGLPFYAGWGLTDDRVPCTRRRARPSLAALVAAVFLRYSRYAHPLTGRTCDALTVARHLAVCRRRDRMNAGHTEIVGIKPWKRWQIDRFLRSPQGDLHYAASAGEALRRQAQNGGRIVVWAAREPSGFAAAAAAHAVPLVRFEDGFLRSVGLGSNHVGGASLVVDPHGIYFDPRQPSGLEQLLQHGSFEAALRERAARLRVILVERGLTKYNFGPREPIALGGAPGQRRLLVPGQVEDDASIRFGAPEVCSNLELLKRVRVAEPAAWIVYKPHPDTEVGTRAGRVADEEVLRHADQVVRGVSVVALFPLIDAVHTMTSLVGFEALLRDIPVTVWGMPFYAGWGLTQDRLPIPRRTRRLLLDELVAGALILYPWYADPGTGLPCEVEDVAERLSAQNPRGKASNHSQFRRIARLCRGLYRSWKFANDTR